MKVSRVVCAAVFSMALVSPLTGIAANGPDVGDIWWTPSESGWGLQLSQSNRTLFATIYVYDNTTFPFWYSGTLTQQSFVANVPVYTGDLYQTRGPGFAADSFNPDDVQRQKVGTITFTSPTVVTGVLTYTVFGTTIVKNVQRMPLGNDDFNGTYFGTYAIGSSGCLNPANNGKNAYLTSFSIAKTGNVMSISAAVTAGGSVFTCTFTGTSGQLGRMTAVNATYACTTGETGTVVFSEMIREGVGILGRVRGSNNLGCTLEGSFSALD